MATYRAVVKVTSPDFGGQGVNIFHFDTPGADPGDAVWNDAIDALGDFYNGVAPKIPSSTTISFDGEVTDVNPSVATVISGLHTFSVVGGTTVQGLPPANCIVVGWRTGIASRRARGRTFLGPIAQDTNGADGNPTAAVVLDIESAADALIAAVDALTGLDFVVYSPTHNEHHVVTSEVVHRKYAVLRSRRD